MLTIIADALMTATRQRRDDVDERIKDQHAHNQMLRRARLENERPFRLDRQRDLW
ncbi:hypothetical protein [Cognatishimia sp. MH4019]|uniref:hypothetical protein n=1 Tax=Cognatishimia sp. MH4019 TaxID=2854030 RepID=UPI001CD5F5FF|nr:hypothetical protein [Cognatishimia sp. MH4019]